MKQLFQNLHFDHFFHLNPHITTVQNTLNQLLAAIIYNFFYSVNIFQLHVFLSLLLYKSMGISFDSKI